MSVVNLGNGAPKKKAAKKTAKKKAPAMKSKGMKAGGAAMKSKGGAMGGKRNDARRYGVRRRSWEEEAQRHAHGRSYEVQRHEKRR